MRLVGVLILILCVVLLVLFGSHVVVLVCPSGRRIVVGSWGLCSVAVRMLPVVFPAGLRVLISARFPPLDGVRRLVATGGIMRGAEFLLARCL